ncbi:hypothetical protein ABFS83_02G108800 [Erythranthe nasuta]
MACALSGSSCAISAPASSSRLLLNKFPKKRQTLHFSSRVRASSEDQEDCNTEECAPDKEVGKLSVEWLADEKTRVVGTFPPRKKGWTGYVEKDTAGQTNIYSIEPAVYIAESVLSSGTAGSSADGTENTAAIFAGLALISIAAASSVVLQVGKNPPPVVVQTAEYSGPSLSYYINKFKPPEIIEASSPAPPVADIDTSAPLQITEEAAATSAAPQEVSQPDAAAAAAAEVVEPQDDTSASVPNAS